MGHHQFRFVGCRAFGHSAEDNGRRDGRGIAHIVSAGEIEDRLTQFRRPTDRLIDRIEAGNPPQEYIVPLGVADGIEDQAAERQG